jgi:DNA-binding winged helix-turn-helix (wHTH) protein
MPDYFQEPKRATFGRITLEIYGRKVTLSSRLIHLLAYLIREKHRYVPKKELGQVIGLGSEAKSSRVHLIISHLRETLQAISRDGCIETQYGVGYRFLPPANH